MEFFLWLIGIPLAIYWFFRLFGKRLFQLAMRRLVKNLEKEAQRQSAQYQRSYGGNQGEENIYVDDELKVSNNPVYQNKGISEDEIVEDVEFEEIRDRSRN